MNMLMLIFEERCLVPSINKPTTRLYSVDSGKEYRSGIVLDNTFIQNYENLGMGNNNPQSIQFNLRTQEWLAEKKLVMRDSLGRRLSIRNLAEMTSRFEETKKSLNSLKEQEIEIVLASSHNNASKRCEIWQGKLFILDVVTDAVLKQNVDLNYKPTPIKKVDGIDCYSLRDAMAHGFLGYNCRHRLIKYQYEFIYEVSKRANRARKKPRN